MNDPETLHRAMVYLYLHGWRPRYPDFGDLEYKQLWTNDELGFGAYFIHNAVYAIHFGYDRVRTGFLLGILWNLPKRINIWASISSLRSGQMFSEGTNLVQIPCHFCNSKGKLPITKEMLIEAGIFKNYVWEETCPYCFGDKFIITEMQATYSI